jgi:hypothetical protein
MKFVLNVLPTQNKFSVECFANAKQYGTLSYTLDEESNEFANKYSTEALLL